MLIYLLQSGLILTILLALYHGFLHRQNKFSANRIFLLLAPIFSFAAPAIAGYFPQIQAAEPLYTVYFNEVVIRLTEQVMAEQQVGRSFPINAVLLFVYLSVATILLCRFIYGLRKLQMLKSNSEQSIEHGFPVFYSFEVQQVFSFWNSIFLPAMHRFKHEELNMILKHEVAHIGLWHSADRLVTQSFKVLFWFMPPIYWLEHLQKEVHEFQADDYVIRSNREVLKPYSLLLLQQHSNKLLPVTLPVHPFISTLKNRITMMTQNENHRKSVKPYAVLFPVMILAIIAVSMINPDHTPHIKKENSSTSIMHDTTILQVAEQMPMFIGCEEIENLDDRKSCSDQKMLQFIYQNIRYPKAALKEEAEGTTVVRFIVERDGSVSNVEIVRSVSEEIDEESLRVVKLMEREIMWVPGMQRDKPVRVSYNLPIRFRLNEKD